MIKNNSSMILVLFYQQSFFFFFFCSTFIKDKNTKPCQMCQIWGICSASRCCKIAVSFFRAMSGFYKYSLANVSRTSAGSMQSSCICWQTGSVRATEDLLLKPADYCRCGEKCEAVCCGHVSACIPFCVKCTCTMMCWVPGGLLSDAVTEVRTWAANAGVFRASPSWEKSSGKDSDLWTCPWRAQCLPGAQRKTWKSYVKILPLPRREFWWGFLGLVFGLCYR